MKLGPVCALDTMNGPGAAVVGKVFSLGRMPVAGLKDRFASIEAARRHCQVFFGWYNDEHRHTGLGLHVPADVHYGTAAITRDKRAGVLDAAYAAHPERFVRKPPQPPNLPSGSWINKPEDTEEAAQ